MAAAAPTPPRDRLIAEGATARVFVSRDSTGRPAALKLSRSAACDAALIAEADAATRFSHPALLPILGHGIDRDGRTWLLLPLLSGKTLEDWGPSPAALLDGLGPIADALDYIHHLGYGHADLKPSNLLLAQEGHEARLLLADLGLISELGKPAPGGTPAYLSPARLDGNSLSWRDDLHALAVLVYERIAGQMPWHAVEGEALLQDIRLGRVRSLRSRRPDLPGTMESLLVATLQGKDGTHSVADWLDHLRAELGLRPLPRRLFLRPAASQEEDISSRERLAAWLRTHLYSSTSPAVGVGREELRSLEELARGDARRLRNLLDHLLAEQHLQDQSGQAIFAGDPTELLDRLRAQVPAASDEPTQSGHQWERLLTALPMAFSRGDLLSDAESKIEGLETTIFDLLERGLLSEAEEGRFEAQGIVDLHAAASSSLPLPRALFASQWQAAESRPGARLQLLALAHATNAHCLIDSIPQNAMLDVVERAPG